MTCDTLCSAFWIPYLLHKGSQTWLFEMKRVMLLGLCNDHSTFWTACGVKSSGLQWSRGNTAGLLLTTIHVWSFLFSAHKLREQQRCSFILIPPQWGLNFLDLGKGCTKSGITYHSQLVSPIMIMLTYKKTIPILPLLFVFQLYLVIPIDKNTYRYNSNTYETLHCKQWACS